MAETRSDRLRRWKTRIETAKKIRTDWETQYHVKELERTYLGIQDAGTDEEVSDNLNHFFATAQTHQPALLSRSTSFLIKPKLGSKHKPFGTVESKAMEGVLRAISEQDDNLYNDASLALAQAFFRIGVLKVSYDPQFIPNPLAGEVEGEPDEVLTDEVYSFEWVNASKMFLPDDGPNMRKWTWIAEEITITLDEAKKDERFSHRSQLKANATADPEAADSYRAPEEGDPGEEEHARFCYYECWDVQQKKLYAWADGQDFEDFLIHDDFPPGVEDHPYAILRFIPILGPDPSPWPLPPTFNWLSPHQQYNVLRRMEVNAAKRAARKFLYEQNTFPDEEELDKFTSNADMEGVSVTDLSRPPMMFGESSINPDVWRASASLSNDWRIITGTSGTRLGNPDADTATEAVLIEQSAGLRDSEKKLTVEKWISQAGKKMLQLVKQTLTMDIWIQLKGFSDSEFREFLQLPGFQTMLALQVGQENVPAFLAALEINPMLQERFKERFGSIKPLQVSRSQLIYEADVGVMPSAARPLQQAQLLRLVSVLGPVAFLSPTFLEELMASFDLPQGDRIAEEIMIGLRQQMQAQQAQQPRTGTNGSQRMLSDRGPLGMAGGRGGGV